MSEIERLAPVTVRPRETIPARETFHLGRDEVGEAIRAYMESRGVSVGERKMTFVWNNYTPSRLFHMAVMLEESTDE